MCKHSNFEHPARSPQIVSAPGLSPAQQHSEPVEFVVINPTLCDLAGLPILDELQGLNMVRVLKDPTTVVKPYTDSQWPRGSIMG